jgi:hypothetical protein
MAKDSYTWYTIDAELADLTGDSLSEGPPGSAVRGHMTSRG